MTTICKSGLRVLIHSNLHAPFYRILRFLVVFSLLFASGFQAKATWYESDAQKFFKVSFNPSNGALQIEVFTHNAHVFGCCDVDGTQQLTASQITLSYSTDNANYTQFYYIEHDYSEPKNETVYYPFSASGYEDVPDGRVRIRHITAYVPNNLRNIKDIKLKVVLTRGGGAQGGPETSVDTRMVSILQMSTINTPTFNFFPFLNGSTYEAKAKISYTKSILNEVDNVSTIDMYDGSTSPATRIASGLPISTSGSYDVSLSNASTTYYYQQSAYNGRLTTNSGTVLVPAFTFPKTASATYNSATQQWLFHGRFTR